MSRHGKPAVRTSHRRPRRTVGEVPHRTSRRAFARLAIAPALVLGLAACGGARPAAANAALPRVPAGADHRLAYGIDLNYHDRTVGTSRVPRALAAIRAAGATVVRTGVSWSELEPAPGVYRWGALDRGLALVRQEGLRILLELGHTPGWDLPAGTDPGSGQLNYPPRDCQAGGDCGSAAVFVRALVRHIESSGYFGVLAGLIPINEPQNFAKEWVGGRASQYAVFQQAVFRAAHLLAPRLAVLNGGTEILPAKLGAIILRYAKHPSYVRQSGAFTRALYADPRWCRSIGALDVHVGDHGPVYSPQIVDLSERALERCDGGRFVPVWVTEVGYSYLPAVQRQPELRGELGSRYAHGPRSQAGYLHDTLRALARDRNVVGIDWTFLVSPTDQPGPDGAGLGLLNADWRPEPSLAAYEQAARPGRRQPATSRSRELTPTPTN